MVRSSSFFATFCAGVNTDGLVLTLYCNNVHDRRDIVRIHVADDNNENLQKCDDLILFDISREEDVISGEKDSFI